jgi:hypothetical protein
MWIVSDNHGVARHSGSDWIRYNGTNSMLSPGEVNSMIIDRFDTKWFATGNAGLVRYDNIGWTSISAESSELPGNDVFSVVEDLHGNLWIGVRNSTLTCLDKTGKMTVFGSCCQYNCNHNIIPTVVDKKNNVWCRRLIENGGGVIVFGPDVPDLLNQE